MFEKETWVALRCYLKRRERDLDIPFGDQNACLGGWGQEATSLNWGQWGGCYLGVGVCLVTRWGYLVWHLRECLGTLNVLYCLGQSHQREISPAQDNQEHPQIEALFKRLGQTSQEAIRGEGKAPNRGGLKWSPLLPQVQATVLHTAPITACYLLGCLLLVSSHQQVNSVKAGVRPTLVHHGIHSP